VSATVREKWFSFPELIYLSPLPVGTLLAGILLWRSLGKSERQPFGWAVAIYVLSFLGLAYSLFPYVVMDRLTIWEAAAHESSLRFVLVGALIVLPFLVGYTIYAYRVFRGKARAGLYE
jgi:cytochrome d ubiquinol oxidase subunit II